MKHSKSILLLLAACLSGWINGQIPVVNGWSQFTPSADSRLIYVSDVSGNDATAQFYLPSSPEIGADPFLPVGPILPWKTLAAAKAQLRVGFPDWLLFKRGETWTSQRFGVVTLSGRSATEPLLIGAFGACGERPRLLTGSETLIDFNGASASHVALSGIYATPQTYAGATDCLAVRLINAPFSSFLIEDCFFETFSNHIAIHNLPSYGTSRQNLKVRRCILTDAWKIGGSGGGGLFIANVAGILFEENLLDHNGWKTGVPGAEANAFSHNTYFQVSNTGLVFKNNVVSRASATGGGFRCGGSIVNNLFAANPKGIQFGTHESENGSGGGINWPTSFKTGEVANNVILDSRVEPFEQGTGLQIQRIKNAAAHHNIVAGFTPVSEYNTGVILNEVENVDFHHNIVHNWGNNHPAGNPYSTALACGAGIIGSNQLHHNDFQMHLLRGSCINQDAAFVHTTFSNNRYFNVLTGGSWFEQWFQPQGSYANWLAASGETGSTDVAVNYLDAARNMTTYQASIGASGGLPEFVAGCKLNSRCAWDADFSAAAVNDYIRFGFDLVVNLPVELVDLRAKCLPESVEIRWETASAIQLKSFEIQRSDDGIAWKNLAEITPKLPTNEPHRYAWHDRAPLEFNYYRLQMTDEDGSTAFSAIVSASLEMRPDLLVFPNPATDLLHLKPLNLDLRRVHIFNSIGQLVLQLESPNDSPLFIGHLPPGAYLIQAFSASFSVQKRFVK